MKNSFSKKTIIAITLFFSITGHCKYVCESHCRVQCTNFLSTTSQMFTESASNENLFTAKADSNILCGDQIKGYIQENCSKPWSTGLDFVNNDVECRITN